MSATTAQRLAALRNRPTMYEAVIKHPNGGVVLLGYSARHTGRGLRDMLRLHGQQVADYLGAGDDARLSTKRGERDMRITTAKGEVRGIIQWTGRTKRDVLCSGKEHPFIRDVADAGGVQ